MLNLLKALRYFVFVVFVICNAIITSVAVWNLSLVDSVALDATAKQVDAFLIFVGAAGLVLVFPILFLDLYGKDLVVQRVWFELVWVGLFWVMELVGAATITSQSNAQLCDSTVASTAASLGQSSPCPSAQVLQAFSFICAILLLGYLTLLALSAIHRSRHDSAIWHRSVRKFPWFGVRLPLSSAPESPSTPRFEKPSGPQPVLAPQPRRATNNMSFSEAFVSHRRGISEDYDIEHFQFPPRETAAERPVPPIPAAMAPEAQTRQPRRKSRTTSQPPAQPVQATPFYPNYVRDVIDYDSSAQPQSHGVQAESSQRRALPPSPPPLGDWPRLDAPRRGKRKPLPTMPAFQPPQQPSQQTEPHAIPVAQRPSPQVRLPPPEPLQTRRSQSKAPQIQPLPPSPYVFDPAVLSSALESLDTESPSRSRPSGPRRRSTSGEFNHRPPRLDLSRISNHRTKDSS